MSFSALIRSQLVFLPLLFQRAAQLEPSDALYTLLLQVTGPAHVPWNDPRWQELLHGYNVWVHLESHSIPSACNSMAKHAATSSNLAALCLHVSRMLKELVKSCSQTASSEEDEDRFTRTIALVGKSRATAGALNLLRILIHHVLVEAEALEDVFTYRTRDVTERHRADRLAGQDLVHACLSFLSCMASPMDDSSSSSSEPWQSVPELYDTTNQCLQLVLVLLSTQLYQPMISSAQRRQQPSSNNDKQTNYFFNYILRQAQRRYTEQQNKPIATYDSALGEPTPPLTQQQDVLDWTPTSVLQACLSWQLHRPPAPERSIAHHHAELAQSVVQSKEKRVGSDGMYESHFVVMASKKSREKKDAATSSTSSQLTTAYGKPPSRLILDATKGVLVLSSSLILLPFRLMIVAFGLWGNESGQRYDAHRKEHLQSTVKRRGGRTNDVLWLSDSPIADSGSALLLLLVHNYRAAPNNATSSQGIDAEVNPFRIELAQLGDERWQAGALDPINGGSDPFASLPGENGNGGNDEYEPFVNQEEVAMKPLLPNDGSSAITASRPHHLTTNFEAMLESFGDTVHTEVSALLLYTILQTSPTFASFIVVRSDLDTLVLPLLRTLYFSSALRHYSPHGMSSASKNSNGSSSSTVVALRSCPFRSPSQLYVILILLLLFSQDPSFGKDAFVRTIVPSVPWYKERQLHDISLGSVLLLTLLRSITFNLNKLQDAFLLSNCCAVLMNLSHNIVDLHDYAAMRLVSVTVSALKRYCILWAKSQASGNHEDEHDITTPVGMYGEVRMRNYFMFVVVSTPNVLISPHLILRRTVPV